MARLEQVAEREGISRAEAIRRAIDAAYSEAHTANAAREAAFGLWKGRKRDSLAYVDSLRDEWEERLSELHGSRYVSPAGSAGRARYRAMTESPAAARVSEKRPRKPRGK